MEAPLTGSYKPRTGGGSDVRGAADEGAGFNGPGVVLTRTDDPRYHDVRRLVLGLVFVLDPEPMLEGEVNSEVASPPLNSPNNHALPTPSPPLN